jgi:hypothetical protein
MNSAQMPPGVLHIMGFVAPPPRDSSETVDLSEIDPGILAGLLDEYAAYAAQTGILEMP